MTVFRLLQLTERRRYRNAYINKASASAARAMRPASVPIDFHVAGEPLTIGIGIATRLVLVGDLAGVGGALEHGVVGEASNLAGRLQAMAKPGAI
jgi:class 3 adenylate cyclase